MKPYGHCGSRDWSNDMNSELHCLIGWVEQDKDFIVSAIREKFAIKGIIDFEPFHASEWERSMDELYRFDGSTHGEKGKRPFFLVIVEDESPHYAIRSTTRKVKPVNVNMFNMKNEIRQGRSGYLHATDNLEEVHDNLQALSRHSQGLSWKYWTDWRPTFHDLTELFDRFNATPGLEYVVMRNYAQYPEQVHIDEHMDIDILANDYFLLKRVMGGKNRKQPALEDGGYKVANLVIIGDQEVTVDGRHFGDNYYQLAWQKDMIRTRIQHKNFWVMNPENHFYSLLYHGLVHKRKVSETYRRTLPVLAKAIGLNVVEGHFRDDYYMWDVLDEYMKAKHYDYVEPNEKSIPCNPKKKRPWWKRVWGSLLGNTSPLVQKS